MRTLFEVSGMFDISTSLASFPQYAEDPKMVDDERLLNPSTSWRQDRAAGHARPAQGIKNAALPEVFRALGADPAVTLDSLKQEEETATRRPLAGHTPAIYTG